MSRRVFWAMLVAAGVVLGCALGRLSRIDAAQSVPDDAAVQEQQADLAEQIKEIRTQVKDINTLLHSGTLRVVVVINPDK